MRVGYYTVVIPCAPARFATEWHPVVGAPLTRGAFTSEAEAIEWARDNLKGAPYSVRFVSTKGD